ncbi:type I-B CRISPR-associated protein Cas7/Csh2 [Mesoaciditoga lauensis]|uniref:type I-B CRISPR-associated protein Cas7/Csh2 n=1 Tax=Mesoaciditoga lauensis TaxID=1495039 RepID=UPI0005679EB2|nr:type I-B CRISPR-associated protein Cas7/Csh2 [Mesoaciditoga lauensis]
MEKINRSEFLFFYDVKWSNPNGDPNDDDKPRYDSATSHLLVSDVRLKRTVRDYLEETGKTIFITKKGDVQTSEARAKEIIGEEKADPLKAILSKSIDIRMFGGMLPTKLAGKKSSGDSITLRGPIQMRMGESLNAVDLSFIKGTAAFASKEGAKNASFREEWLVPYALISFYGVINQNAALETNLSSDDIEDFFNAVWFGTKNLITRSKMEQLPKLLIQVEYKQGVNTHIGGLDSYISLNCEKTEDSIRSLEDYSLDMAKFADVVLSYAKKINRVRYAMDPRLKVLPSLESLKGHGFEVEKFEF